VEFYSLLVCILSSISGFVLRKKHRFSKEDRLFIYKDTVSTLKYTHTMEKKLVKDIKI